MLPALASWLARPGPPDARLAPVQSRRWHTVIRGLARQIGMNAWPANCMRHSFASYHLTAYQDAARTALILGHGRRRGILEPLPGIDNRSGRRRIFRNKVL